MPKPGEIDVGRQRDPAPVRYGQPNVVDHSYLMGLRHDIAAAPSDFFLSQGKDGDAAVVALQRSELIAVIDEAHRSLAQRGWLVIAWGAYLVTTLATVAMFQLFA